MNTRLQSRTQAAYLLAEKMRSYENTDAVVVAIPRGGVPVGLQLANLLQLPFEIIPCKRMKDPADSRRSIGSVSQDDAFINDTCLNIPQDYISHQIQLNQHALKEVYKFYRGERAPVSLTGKTVILVDDILKSGDTVMACLKTIKKQEPAKLIVAVPVVVATAMQQVQCEVDEFVSIIVEASPEAVDQCYDDFSEVKEEEVKNLLLTAEKV